MRSNELLNYVERNCARVDTFLSEMPSSGKEDLMEEILAAPNPKSAVGRIDDLLGTEGDHVVKGILGDRQVRGVLLATISGSGFLSSILCRRPDLLESHFAGPGHTVHKTRPAMEKDLRDRTSGITRIDDFDTALRWYKQEEYVRIGSRDLAGSADLREVMQELSDLAGAFIQVALEFHWGRLVCRHGAPPGQGDDVGFVVLGMGKLSGGELNFSSDVDLIFLCAGEQGRTLGDQSISLKRFYDVLAQSVTRSLNEVTEEGFVFRVDLRLRPEGERGELVPSVENALDYYLSWGRTWERVALMKAVPVAGDRGLGWSFLEELEPFIYRRHLDYSTLDDMREMKQRVQAQLRRKPGINIKLGQGGIREIEFFVQALQLINAGRTPTVRSPGTLEALGLLVQANILDETTAKDLREAYCFFRKTEHRIQINHQIQTHELPRTGEEQQELARRMGYHEDALTEFLSDLERLRGVVEDLFSGLFYHSNDENEHQVSSEAKRICENILDEAKSVDLLSAVGFEDPQSSYPILKSLIIPSERRGLSEKGRRLLERLAPLLIDELLDAPEPGSALISLDRYIDSLRVGSGYLSTLLENPATVRFLIKILGESRFFTDLLVRHPQSFDSLIARHSSEPVKDRGQLQKDLFQRLAYCTHYEAELDVLRMFKNEEILRIGAGYLSEEIDSSAARRLTTDLAEVCLEAAMEIARKEMGRKFGEPDFGDSVPFVILGMGKLGGQEMTYHSDLDVIFIYDPPSETVGRLSAHDWFSRFAGRIISVLSVPTSEGIAFEIDARLRPSGNQGPLVSTLSAFREYHKTTSEVWEKQALVKARPVVGPAGLRNEVNDILRDCIARAGAREVILEVIARLRKRIEAELAGEDMVHVDVKTGHGGLVDVEFFVQANILIHADTRPEILRSNTLEALAALYRAGLVTQESFHALDSGYRFLSSLEDRVRLMEQRSVDRLSLEGDRLKGLANRLGYGAGGDAAFVDDYFKVTRGIRKIYNSLFHQE